MRKFLREFKEFISRGSIMDLAVGVIIGGAFSAIVSSLVSDIIMPLIVWIFPVQNLADMCVVLNPAVYDPADSSIIIREALTWNYGKFIEAIITFILTALVIFILLKIIMKIKGISTPKYGEVITKEEYIKLRKEGKTKQQIAEIDAKLAADKKAEEEQKAAEAAANTTEALLKDIKEILKNKD